MDTPDVWAGAAVLFFGGLLALAMATRNADAGYAAGAAVGLVSSGFFAGVIAEERRRK